MMVSLRRFVPRAAALGAALALVVGCGDSVQRQPKLHVQVIGWGPGDDGSVGFQARLPTFNAENQVQVSLTRPTAGQVLGVKSFAAAARSATLPKLHFGTGMRLEFAVKDGNAQTLAAGATPMFDFQKGDIVQGFRIQVDPVNDFAPVGSVVKSNGRSQLTQSRMDYRAVRSIDQNRWLGRIGHATVPTDGANKLLVVGGADIDQVRRPGTMPQFRTVHDDLMEFDPATGYFTDLSYDSSTGAAMPNGADRLLEARAFHTVTPVGHNKFLVVGGLTNGPHPLNSIELIDLNAAPGTRVQQLIDSSTGSPAQLHQARAFHTAVYRPADNTVVVAGGIGQGGATNVLNSVEFIHLDTGSVETGPSMAHPRAEAQAVLMNDNSTIWVLGGRDATGALKSTEVIQAAGSTGTVQPGATMNEARFGFKALRITPGNQRIVMALGGYTDLDGHTSDTFEFANLDRQSFLSAPGWHLNNKRGNPQAVELPNTHNIVVLGGRDASGTRVSAAEVLQFQGLTENNPYTAQSTNTSSVNDRADSTATLLSNGKIVLIGGIGKFNGNVTTLDSAEYFTPLDPRQAAVTVN